MSINDLSGFWRYSIEDRPEFSASDYDDHDWPSMWIPGNWFLSGLDHHGVVWFRRVFHHAPPEDDPGRRYSLHFDGVDYAAQVYLNGSYLDEHLGYFEAFRLDVTDQLRAGENCLAVRVDSPFEPEGPGGWHLHKRLIKGVLNHHDCRPGGAWEAGGQAYNTGGIWNRVILQAHGDLVLERCLLSADLDGENARLGLDLRLFNHSPERIVNLKVSCRPDNFSSPLDYSMDFSVHAPNGYSRHQLVLDTPGVSFWQPWDRGEPRLYTVRLDGDLNYSTNFGFRSVQVDHEYNWTINGERFFPRGSNYIATQWLAEALFPERAVSMEHPFGGHGEDAQAPGSWFERDVALMVRANLNIIRVHAHVLPVEFYHACDRAGLLVWQDFPLQWGYSDDPEFQDQAAEQAEAMVYQGFNHPSIVAWCCHNESPWDAEWMAEKSGEPFDLLHNRSLDDSLGQIIRGLDPTRYVHMNSGSGDGHPYPGWYFGTWRDFGDLPGAPFVTEYGAQALPVAASVQQTFSELGADGGHAHLKAFKSWLDERPQISETQAPVKDDIPRELRAAYETWETWRFHNFQPMETFTGGRVSLGSTLNDFITSSQEYQNRILQYGTENYRRNMNEAVKGIFQFMFCDPWPAITWSVVDYWRRPKPGYAVLRRAMQPVLPCADIWGEITPNQPFDLPLWVVNDRLEGFHRASCTWEIRDPDGNLVQSGRLTINVPAFGISAEVVVNCAALAPGTYRLELSLRDQSEIILGENIYEFGAGARGSKAKQRIELSTGEREDYAFEGKPMNIRLAIAGAGFMAEIHARAILTNPNADLVAVVEKFPQKCAQFASKYGIKRQYESIEELLHTGYVDGLVVCTPNFLHASQSITALQAGMYVMVEKPMAMNADEAEEMLEASLRSEGKLMVAHCWRFDDEVNWLREKVMEGRFGELVRTKSYGVHVGWGPSGWFTDRRLSGGGALVDMGIHAIDTARYLIGDPEPLSVYAHLGTHYIQGDVDDTGLILIHWENEVSSYIESGWWQPHADGLEAGTQVYGTRGFGQLFPTYIKVLDRAGNLVVHEPSRSHPRDPHCEQAMYENQMDHFVKCIQEGRPPMPGVVEGLVNMRLLDAIYKSAKKDQVVKL